MARSSHNARRFVPGFDLLEARLVQSCTAVLSGTQLTIAGDGGANVVQILDNGHDGAGSIKVTCDGVTSSFSQVRSIKINTKGGDDSVTYRTLADLTVPRTLVADLGNGADTFFARYGGDIVNADQSLTINGGFGDDHIKVDATADVDVLNSRVNFSLNGNAGKDVLDVLYSGELHGKLGFLVDAGTGDDVVHINAHFEANSAGDVFTSVNGDAGDDKIFISLKKDNTEGFLSESLFIRGGLGKDELHADIANLAPGVNSIDSIEK